MATAVNDPPDTPPRSSARLRAVAMPFAREFWTIFFAQRSLIVSVFIVVVACALAVVAFWPETYAAQVFLLVKGKPPQRTPEALEKPIAFPSRVTREDLESEITLISAPEVIGRALASIESRRGQERFPMKEVERVRGQMQTRVEPSSQVIHVTFHGMDRQGTVELLGEIVAQYLTYRKEISLPAAAEAFFSDQATKFRKALDESDRRLEDLYGERAFAAPLAAIQGNLLVIKDLEQDLSKLVSRSLEEDALLSALEHALATEDSSLFSALDNDSIDILAGDLLRLQIERGDALRTYKEGSPKVSRMDAQIAELRTLLRTEAGAYAAHHRAVLNGLEQQIHELSQKIADFRADNVVLQQNMIETQKLERERALAQQSYEIFTMRREEARIQRAIENSDYSEHVVLIGTPFAAERPAFPRAEIVLPLGLAGGLVLGITLGFLREYLAPSIRTPVDVEANVQLPVLFSIPDLDVPEPHLALRSHAALWLVLLALAAAVLWPTPGREGADGPKRDSPERSAGVASASADPRPGTSTGVSGSTL